MITIKSGKRYKETPIRTVFLLSAMFFLSFSFFGVYRYKIYSPTWFLLFFFYETLFYIGLCSPRFVFVKANSQPNAHEFEFVLTNCGARILWIACCLSVLSFLYFIALYHGSVGQFQFGAYTITEFQESRGTLDKVALLLTQIGGDSAFLILSADRSTRHKKLKAASHVTLFLSGIRHLLMGSRFSIAVEFLVLFAIKWPSLQRKVRFSAKARLLIGATFAYLFATRPVNTALQKYSFYAGDMEMKPFWLNLYKKTDGKVDFLYVASDYLGESPYIFSYYCAYELPNEPLWGGMLLRSLVQIVHYATGLGDSFLSMSEHVAGGQYSGFAYSLIADFGVFGSVLAAFLFGCLFSQVEQNRRSNRVCVSIYPAVKVICFFAPVYYFIVGRVDYAILFCSLLAPLCLKKTRRSINSYASETPQIQ